MGNGGYNLKQDKDTKDIKVKNSYQKQKWDN